MSGYEVNFMDNSFRPLSNLVRELTDGIFKRRSIKVWNDEQTVDKIKGPLYFDFEIQYPPKISQDVLISEVLIDPDDSNTKNTWITLSNLSDNHIDISGWRLVDNTDHTRVISNMMIAPGQSITIYNVAPLELGKEGNEIRLFNKQSKTVDQVAYLSNMVAANQPIHFSKARA